MLNRAPNVYIPVDPDDDGVALPTILSIVVHGALFGFILFFHHAPTIDTPKPIETSIITPEELAGLQAQVSANRQALESSGSDSLETQSTTSQLQEPEEYRPSTSDYTRPSYEHSNQTHSIFARSDDPADDFDPPITDGYDPDYQEPIEPPLNYAASPFDSGVEADDGSPSNPTSPSDTPLPNGNGTNAGGNGADKASIEKALSRTVKDRWSPPKERFNQTITVLVTLDPNTGNITNVNVESIDDAIVKSVKSTILAMRPADFREAFESGYTNLEITLKPVS